jgi:hypothetical protein
MVEIHSSFICRAFHLLHPNRSVVVHDGSRGLEAVEGHGGLDRKRLEERHDDGSSSNGDQKQPYCND